MMGWKFIMKTNRSVKDGSPRLLFDYVLKEMEGKVGKAQYHAIMRIKKIKIKILKILRLKIERWERGSTTP